MSKTFKPKTTPSHMGLTAAVYDNNLDLVCTLLDAGADVNEPSVGFASPLHAAVCRSQFQIIELLLSRGASPHRGKNDMISPFGEALRRYRLNVVQRLLAAGVKLSNEPDALEYAIIGGSSEALTLLLKNGVSMKHAGHCLRKAAQLGRFSCVKQLVDAGVDPEKHPDYSVNLLGEKLDIPETPRDAAANSKHKHIVALLDGKKVDMKAALAAEQKIPLRLKFKE